MKTFKLLAITIAFLGLCFSAAAEVFTSDEIAVSYDIKEIDEKPVPVKQQEPKVTAELKNQKGRVYVAFIVNEEGKVDSLRCIKTTSELLKPVVLNAVEKWEFKPGKVSGDKVAVRVILPIRVDFS